MNTPMHPHDERSDAELEAFLAEDSELIKRYRTLPLTEPGKHLDAAILGRASNAVRRPVAGRHRWLIPLASAASVVAAAGIGWRVHVAQQQENAASHAPTDKYDVMEIDLQSGDNQRALDTAVMPPQSPQKAGAISKEEPEAKRQQSLSEIIAGPERDEGVTLDRRAVEEPHVLADHALSGRAPEQREAMPQSSSSAGAFNQAPAVAAPVPATESNAELEAIGVGGSRAKIRREQEQAIEDDLRSDADAMDVRQRANDQQPMLAPIDWIERIRMLIRARRMSQVRDEIDRFRLAYPSYRLPSDISRYER
jgi:hypothetical protein